MRFHRRTAPRVVDGQVRRKNCWRGPPDYRATHQVRIERFGPRPGYRHFVAPADATAFLALLPGWRELAIGLQRVVLSSDTDCLGWHEPGTVAICAWEERCVQVLTPEFHVEHAGTLARLGVPCRQVQWVECPGCDAPTPVDAAQGQCAECGWWWHADVCLEAETGCFAEFTAATVQAFLLVHVLVHELGHHHDRMTSPRQRRATRGERYAEQYALRHEGAIWEAYCRVFRGSRRRGPLL
jgi:hypothetical protein